MSAKLYFSHFFFIHEPRGTGGGTHTAAVAIIILLVQRGRRGQLGGSDHGTQYDTGTMFIIDHIAGPAERGHSGGHGQISETDGGGHIKASHGGIIPVNIIGCQGNGREASLG